MNKYKILIIIYYFQSENQMLKREMTSMKTDYKVRKNSDMKMKVRGMKLKGKFIDFKFQVTIIYLIIERESNAGRGDVIYEK